ncbi:type II secretion system protein E [Thauera sp. 27]|uniref:ATPase, T2SS/T4P/T4SS family n=1 Tax=Thauera sp. 27 TaxID=305700 RepID=UPI0002CF29F4|nr:ATPase, T2SS/T4P/T4SS family [Thauera sp. 27]ENO77598.1 type II secretion system protein E [Thauera sp. 27]
MITQTIEATCVREMTFADLYLGHPSLGNRFSAVPRAPADPVLASPALDNDLKALYQRCVDSYSAIRDSDFKLEYDGVSYRVAIMQSMGGLVFVLRKMVSTIRSMQELGVPSVYTQPLMQQNLRGLLLIAGTMNSGKTTTAGAIIAGRLARYGGVAVTAEDPVELPLEGEYGLGVCFQTHASRERGGFAESCRSLVRWGAKIIYLGEIRDGDTAVEALRAGVNGHLVISTLHAEDIQTALRRMLAMSAEHFDTSSAQSLLADGLVGVMHQRLVGDPRRLEADLLMLSDAPSATSMIRDGKLERLASEIRLQQARLIQSAAMMDQR